MTVFHEKVIHTDALLYKSNDARAIGVKLPAALCPEHKQLLL